ASVTCPSRRTATTVVAWISMPLAVLSIIFHPDKASRSRSKSRIGRLLLLLLLLLLLILALPSLSLLLSPALTADGPRRTPSADGLASNECKSVWSPGWHAPIAPGPSAGRRRSRAGVWRSCGEACAASPSLPAPPLRYTGGRWSVPSDRSGGCRSY